MSKLTRRQFFGATAIGAGAVVTIPTWAAKESKELPSSTDRVQLGQTGITVSRVAMGTGMNGGNQASNQTRLGKDNFKKLIMHGYENGLNFLDLADLYGSHAHIKSVLEDIPRDKVVLLSKLWFRKADWCNPSGGATPEFERFSKELGVEMIDIMLIHCVMNQRWPEQQERVRDEMSKLKQEGKIRAVGCSCHSLESLQVAAEHPWVDVIFTRINHGQKSMDADPETVANVLKTARKNGKAVVGMKIYGANTLIDEKSKDTSLRFVTGKPIEDTALAKSINYTPGTSLVDAMTIGFEKIEHIDDTVQHLTKVLRV
jgi:1-deoxyxylulose-5-phosphate synthase